MECPACSAQNDDDSLFCESCGGALERSCASCGGTSKASARFCRQCGQAFDEGGARADAASAGATRPSATPSARAPRDYTPRHLAEKILSSKSALEGERKQVSVFFADVKSSMQLAQELDPEEWHIILERFFEILSEGVHRFEGTVNQYTGDGIMALFGAPVAHEDHAQRACYAALHLADSLKSYTDQLRVDRGLNFSVRMGINSGDVVVGKIGDDLRMDYTAQGHTVGLAQRMESLAEPGRAMLAGPTIDLVEGYFALRDLGETHLKGVERPVRVAELEGVGGMRTRLDRSRARGLSKFVGRDEEMSRLEASLERALTGDGQVVGVVAEAGSGKSRLCYEFLERCRARGIVVRTTTGVPHGQAVPLEPILLFYREIFGILSGDDDAQARQKIAGSVAQASSEELDSLPLLFDFMRVPDPAQPPPDLLPDERDREVMQLLRRLTVARSRREPAVLVFEDLHWMDPQTDLLLESIVDAAASTRTLLLANFRPEYRADWMGRSHYQQIALRPLDADSAAELLGEWLGPHPSLAGFPELVCDRTAGNPFFMEEVVQSQIEAGALMGSRGHFELARPIESLSVPASVQSLLAARIDLLAEHAKRLLQTAAVIGEEVPDALLLQVSSMGEDALRTSLRELVQGEFLYEASLYPSLDYAFKHPLTREVAYGSLLRDRRQAIHAEVAKALEATAEEGAEAEAPMLAHHWEQAGRPFEAAHWQSIAANALGLSQARESLFHWRKVIELLADAGDVPEAGPLRGQARARIIYAASRSAQSHDEVVKLFDAARRELGEGDSLEAVVTLTTYSLTRAGAGYGEDARSITREAIDMARRLGDRAALAMALGNACVVYSPWEDPDQAFALSDEVEELLAQDPQLATNELAAQAIPVSRAMRIMACSASGRGEEIGPLLERLRAQMVVSEDPLELTVARWVSTFVSASRGDIARALEDSRQALVVAERGSNAAMTYIANWARGLALLRAGRAEEAVPYLERSIATAVDRRVNMTTGCNTLGLLCEAHIALGELEAASRAAERAIQLANDLGLTRGLAMGQLARARVFLVRGPDALPDADAAIEAAASQLSQSRDSDLRPELALVRAERAALADDPAAREAALREAIRLYRESGEPERVKQTEELL